MTKDKSICEFNWKAPDFELPSTSGKLFTRDALLKDLLPSSQFIANVKMKPEETSETVEFAIKLQDVLLPIDSHWPVEKYKAIDDAYNANDKEAQAEARKDLAAAFRLKAKSVNLKYIAPPKSTDFAIVYVPTEGLRDSV